MKKIPIDFDTTLQRSVHRLESNLNWYELEVLKKGLEEEEQVYPTRFSNSRKTKRN